MVTVVLVNLQHSTGNHKRKNFFLLQKFPALKITPLWLPYLTTQVHFYSHYTFSNYNVSRVMYCIMLSSLRHVLYRCSTCLTCMVYVQIVQLQREECSRYTENCSCCKGSLEHLPDTRNLSSSPGHFHFFSVFLNS